MNQNEINYEEEIARRDNEELEQIKSEKELNKLSQDSLKQNLENVSMDIFELAEKIKRVESMSDLDEDVRNYAIDGFKRKLTEAKETKRLMDETLSNVRKRRDSLDLKEEQNKNRQESIKKHAEQKKEIEAKRQEKIKFASDRLKYDELTIQFIQANPDSDAFKTYMKTHDLAAVRQKYESEFDKFVNDNSTQNYVDSSTDDKSDINSDNDKKDELKADVVNSDISIDDKRTESMTDVVMSKNDEVMDELASMGLYQSEEKDDSDVNDSSVVNFNLENDNNVENDQDQKSVSDIDKIKSHIPDDLLNQGETNSKPIEYTQTLNLTDIEKAEDLLPHDDKQEASVEDVERPEDLLPHDNKQETDVDLEPEVREKVSVITQVKNVIKEVLDGPYAPVAVAGLFAIGTAAIAVAGPVGAFTAAGTALSGVGSTGFIAGLGAVGYEATKGRNNK